MKRFLLVASCVTLVLPAACNWSDSARFADYKAENALDLTQGDPPENTTPIGTIHTSRSGWYLFALVPIVSARLEDAMRLMAEEARRMGADGVARITADVRLSSLFTAWSQFVGLTGECASERFGSVLRC